MILWQTSQGEDIHFIHLIMQIQANTRNNKHAYNERISKAKLMDNVPVCNKYDWSLCIWMHCPYQSNFKLFFWTDASSLYECSKSYSFLLNSNASPYVKLTHLTQSGVRSWFKVTSRVHHPLLLSGRVFGEPEQLFTCAG